MSLRILSIVLCIAPSLAVAEWRYDPTYGPAGRALGFGSGGQSIMIDCGNGGYPAVTLHGPRPVPGALADYVLRVDQAEQALIPAECSADGCFLMFEDGAEVRGLLNGLRLGKNLSIGFFRNGHGGDVVLAGSSSAIDQVFAAGCEKP